MFKREALIMAGIFIVLTLIAAVLAVFGPFR
jgi:hypothetical protein